MLHLLDNHLVAYYRHHFFADLAGRFAEIFLHLLLGTDLVDVIVHTHIYLMAYGTLVRLNGIQFRLVKEEFLNSHLLRDDAIGIALDLLTFVLCAQTLVLHFAAENSLVAYYPNHLIYHALSLYAQTQA